MAVSFLAQRRRHQASMIRRLLVEQRALALQMGRLLQQAAVRTDDGTMTVPNQQRTREALKMALWLTVLRPYYWGPGNEPLIGPTPQSPFARLLVVGVVGAVEIEVAHQVSIIRDGADRAAQDWLLTPAPAYPPLGPLLYPTFVQWVDPSGFRLADRIVRTGIDARARVNRFVDYHLGQATPVDEASRRLEMFLTTGERGRTTYGQQGSYAARRLLASEVKLAAGYAAINASALNPLVAGIKWRLNRADTDRDQCDRNSRGGPDGNGVYAPADVPPYPDHVNERCDLVPVASPDGKAVALSSSNRGLFAASFLTQVLLGAREI